VYYVKINQIIRHTPGGARLMLLRLLQLKKSKNPANPGSLRKVSLFYLTLVALSFCTTVLVSPSSAAAESFASPYFQNTWKHSDLPILQGAAKRSYVYGQEGFFTTYEPYVESPNGQRLVQYFDKARMEITRPDFSTTNQYFVTNGLIVKEMVLGNLQLGDRAFTTRYPAYDIPVAGDPINNDSATYASFYDVASTQVNREQLPRVGEPVASTIDRKGVVSSNAALGGITNYAYFEPTLRHNIAKPFWDFFNQKGIIFNGANPDFGLVFNWVYTVGLPITEAYWTTATVGGVRKDVLVQLFERRVLTFTPSNPNDYQVEMGNVGRHYYFWRYDPRYDVVVSTPSRATINPSAGFPGARFVVRSDIFLAGEPIDVTLVLPSGENIANFDVVVANARGELVYTFATNTGATKGEYTIRFDGRITGNRAVTYFKLIGIPGVTE